MPETRGRGPRKRGPRRNVQYPAESTEQRSVPTLTRPVSELAVWRQRQAWEQTAEHLNQHGYAACVPCQLVRFLRRRGLEVWCQERDAV
jgi:hypothetical protein